MRLIDADALMNQLEREVELADDWKTAHEIANVVKYFPTIEPQRMRGRWETIEGWDGDEVYRCSECGEEYVLIDGTPKENGYHFCPNCGADMRGTE